RDCLAPGERSARLEALLERAARHDGHREPEPAALRARVVERHDALGPDAREDLDLAPEARHRLRVRLDLEHLDGAERAARLVPPEEHAARRAAPELALDLVGPDRRHQTGQPIETTSTGPVHSRACSKPFL